MFLSWVCAQIADRKLEPPLHLAVGVLGEADRAGLGDAFEPRGDVDAVAHQVAVALLHHVAQMNADAQFDAPLGRHAGVALDHAVLQLDGAAHRLDHAAELGQRAIAGALDDAAIVHGDRRVDQIAPERAQPRQDAILVGAGEPRVADDVGHQNCRQLAHFGHRRPSAGPRKQYRVAAGTIQNCPVFHPPGRARAPPPFDAPAPAATLEGSRLRPRRLRHDRLRSASSFPISPARRC